ncbi:SAM-dependent methyltransferase [Frankia sp. CNm7]|uniref:SAM-dependent methyltransferase n=1 Tax=Frankia nepalensis TaxID=1836974 RepID=A0A937RH19_9ACTN|nr:SAM-dependent methyltransferase [Frankia nepalensis]MBL7499108.1 SAM-dependent methyltransferase [Frankia nepalensis]MBL7513879.1 SAM-dependent methyltransferase [Frankia nepalensis]MBL7523161.1 SAM-dependent methyltransferase [Frankia nepalensis]MBL7625901.1 SAM-dependent methyltransferase [Frankia nepalensis]
MPDLSASQGVDGDTAAPNGRALATSLNVAVPHSARMWNHWLGGKDNFPADRAAAQRVVEVFPEIIEIARSSRRLLDRVVSHLTGELGIRQFLDVGTGLPTEDNTHEVAQRIAPESRIVYVDNDPLVLVHARALLVGTPEGVTSYVDADVRDPEEILRAAHEVLDFDKPVALVLFGVMANVIDDDEAYGIVRKLVEAVPSGSYLALNDGTASPARAEAIRANEHTGNTPYRARTPEEVARFFDGLELLKPGIVSTPLWRPGRRARGKALDSYCGLARIP